ncbi:MAG: RDD family protein [Elusimicrobia bacterium]|nr:RDD family protein [Elusimicrobiota bacterium]
MPEINPLAGLVQSSAEIELLPAKINDRFIAYVLDVAPFAAVYFGSLYYLVLIKHAERYTLELDHRIGLACAGAYLLYQLIGNAAGATIGKRLMGLRVVRKDGSPLGFFRALVRAAGYVLSTPLCSFGFVIALFHPESRALHDLLCGSLVIERERKNQAESALLFFAAVVVLVAMYAAMIWTNLNRITERDVLAVEKARDGLLVMAQVEEAYRASHPAYTRSLGELAQTSGDADKFREAMAEIFDPNQFTLEAGNRGYRISGVARDAHKTRVAVSGPPAKAE